MSKRIVWLLAAGVCAACASDGIEDAAQGGPDWPAAADLHILPLAGRDASPDLGAVGAVTGSGFSDTEITLIQRFLIARGYGPLGTGGVLDVPTRIAIAAYQTDAARPARGEPTVLLLREARAYLAAVAPAADLAITSAEPGVPETATPPARAGGVEGARPSGATRPSGWVDPDF